MTGFRRPLRVALATLGLAWCGLAAPSEIGGARLAHAGSPFLEAVEPSEAMRSPAYRYANMTNEAALAELDRRGILYMREQPTHGVRAPIRLTGRLHGVHVHSALPPEQRPTTPFEILDARLALALDDFCALLAEHDVEELVHYTMYRPNVPPPGWTPPAQATPAQATPAQGTPAQATSTASQAAKPAATSPPKSAAKPRVSAKKRAPAADAKTTKQEKGTAAHTPGRGKQKSTPDDLKGDHGDHQHDREPFGPDGAAEAGGDLAKAAPAKAAPAKTAPKGKGKGTKKSTSSPSPKTATGKLAPSAGNGSSAAKPQAGTPRANRTASMTTARGAAAAATEAEPPHKHSKWAPPGTRHPAGLAIDFGAVKKRDGRWLIVSSHFDGKIGQRTCGPLASTPEASAARELRAIVCDARERGIFTYALTPNYDAAHYDHVHFEIKPGVTWFLYH